LHEDSGPFQRFVWRPAQVAAGLKDIRDRIGSVSSTKKITDAMKLVAAAKVRRAQEAVVNGRPFAENLVKVSASPSSKMIDRLAKFNNMVCNSWFLGGEGDFKEGPHHLSWSL
jgi:ATP synthase